MLGPHPGWEDYSTIIFSVFGGCCTNAFCLESLLKDNADLGSALTFLQLLYISFQSAPSFIDFREWLPRLKPRSVPLKLWLLQVVLLTRLVVAMCIGYLFLNKRYTRMQVGAVILVTIGVVTATLSKPAPPRIPFRHGVYPPLPADSPDTHLYAVGVGMMALGLVLSGILGAMQEKTFEWFGPHWREGVFYTHALSIPIFAFLLPEVKRGLLVSFTYSATARLTPLGTLIALIGNLVTQSLCVKGVNRLTTRMSSVSANLILTARKAFSLCLSVWWFGDGWNTGMTIGASLVFLGNEFATHHECVGTTG
ncbi:UAA transporter family-domain-containing protein [Cantharellus anzutake]|uniref:UAA transporter family-domain-containing protein n=1 Tax=Cantharellus anzutake TaxID=1750568 RepID=UPI001903FB19|nr:UAA transporter family-domain-containing protein [Cantharellus anzutake]KAF8339186.1 UAA transporter family-domain-containing protein [Cantharellus anzutake]